jgi:hypothetical protein
MTQGDLFGLEKSYITFEKSKICVKCNVEQPEKNFQVANGGNYRRTECNSCNNHLSKVRNMLRKQHPYPGAGYQCPICKRTSDQINRTTFSPFVLDHCHETGKFRGWLCDPCNRGLGAFKDDIKILKKAIDYLKQTS